MRDLTTERLRIRNFTPEDWQDLQKIARDKEASEYAIYDYRFPTSEEEVRNMATWFSQGDSFLAACEMSSGRLIGYIALNGAGTHEKDLGYCFHSAFQGKGYATEACSAVIAYAFDSLRLERLTSATANLNTPSCKLLGRLGFRKTGEGKASLLKSPDGTPIEFTGSSYELEENAWRRHR